MQKLPIGNDEFREIRNEGYYYIDKSLMIKDFIEMGDKVALIARPRRFGKTINMTMIREFFDITVDSQDIFEGLSIMNTPYGERINTTPVIYMTFKDCKGKTAEDMAYLLRKELLREYLRYKPWTEANLSDSYEKERYHEILQTLKEQNTPYLYLTDCLVDLTRIVNSCFQKKPILLIDEYDQPVTSSYEHNYHDTVSTFFSNFYGMALKGNSNLHQALLTGVQRVAKESIFSQLNNPQIYTVMDTEYAPYFGLNVDETEKLLTDYGLELTDNVRKMYDGYLIGGQSMYNPWSILNYAKKRRLENFWVRTSSNYLVREALSHADRTFWDSFDELAAGNETTVWLTLDTAFMERASTYSLWGLLANAGYITITKWIDSNSAVIRIPNGEVMAESQMLACASPYAVHIR